VQTDCELRKSARPCDGVVRRRRADHQARRPKNPAAVRALDRFVDFGRDSEVVGIDD
jgi:hypothetical protein